VFDKPNSGTNYWQGSIRRGNQVKMKIQLNNIQFEYLKSNLLLDQKELEEYFNHRSILDRYVVDIPDDKLDEIRDWAGEKLQKIGFNINYEPTNEGKILEEIIDLFYR
jgi:hypothetical protein